MIMGPGKRCPVCDCDNVPTFWINKQKKYMCNKCIRAHNPPYMTLMKFLQGSYRMLWNLEVGAYEKFQQVEDIVECGWFIRSKQRTSYGQTYAIVYHLEYFGKAKCGRCVNYPYFEGGRDCLPDICKELAVPHKKQSEIQYPPERSRYSKWMRI
jgi:hypothetical protein